MTKRFLIAIAVFILTLTGKLIVDLNLYFNGEVNHHSIGVAIVMICLVGCSWAAGWTSTPMWLFGYWAIFDSLYGLFIGQGAFYVGTTAKLDILQRHYPVIQVLKYGLAVAGTIFFIIKTRKK